MNFVAHALIAGLAVVGTALVAPAASAAESPGLAPLYANGAAAELPDEYIVVLRRDPGMAAADVLGGVPALGGTVRYEYRHALRGFAASLPARALDAVRRDPRVAYVQTVRTHRGGATQNRAPWHLDRVDQRRPPLNTTFRYTRTGQGVNAYIVDSGIRASHAEFGGRVVSAFTSIDDGNGTSDCAGHGTFVAGEVGGQSYGVAKAVTLHAVRVLRCDNTGSTAEIVAGLDWVAANHVKPAVANVSIQSFGGFTDRAMDDAAAGMIDAGVLTVLIAGNFNKGDCQNSPKDPRAITMAASARDDTRGGFSSYGPCVTAFAPGVDLTGAGHTGDTATTSGWSGTSMAAPLATGAVAASLQATPALTMAQAKACVVDNATKNVLTDVGAGSPNRLLYTRFAAANGCA